MAAAIRADVAERVRQLDRRGANPTLATVLASADPADERFIALKHDACADVGIETRDVRVAPDAGDGLVAAVERLSRDVDVDAIFVQAPLPPWVDELAVRRAVAPLKDVDCFHPENVGRLVAGDPRFVPATPAAVLRLFDHYDVRTAGRDVVVVGRSTVIGRPLFHLLLRRAEPGNATVTLCHTRTRDLASKTRAADIVVTAAGQPGLVDGSMLQAGATVVDVSANRVAADTERGYAVVGDVDAESATPVADAITPVPGGVGPVTIAMLLANVVDAAERRTDGGAGAGSRP